MLPQQYVVKRNYLTYMNGSRPKSLHPQVANAVVLCPMNREYVLQIKGISPLMHLARIGVADSRAHAVRALANLCAEE